MVEEGMFNSVQQRERTFLPMFNKDFQLRLQRRPCWEPLGKMLITTRTNPMIYLGGGKDPDVSQKMILLFKATFASRGE